MSENFSISVLIRTFNSAKTLRTVLGSLQIEDNDEILIVDSGSTDETLKVGAEYHGKFTIVAPPFNYSKSLNLGFRAARNDWVLVLSSHSIPQNDAFLPSYRRALAELPKDVVVAYGPSTLSGKSDPMLDSSAITVCSGENYQAVQQICGNANSIYRRSAWLENPFDENIRTSEDKLWIQEMIQRQYRFAYIPYVPTINRNQASLAYMFRKGYSDARTLRSPLHKPMKVRHLAGALKNLGKECFRGEIDPGNWLRRSAHAFGQFLASYQPEDNTPNKV